MTPVLGATGRRRRGWRAGLAGAAGGIVAAASVWTYTGVASAATVTATVSVNATQSVATFPATEMGANLTSSPP